MAAEVETKKPMAVVLVGGGSRSGKSRWALDRARKCGGRLVFIATAEALDDEMSTRIAKHRAERGDEFTTVEEPLELACAIGSAEADAIVRERAKQAARYTDEYVHENPWRAVGVAAGIGLLLGLVLGRR